LIALLASVIGAAAGARDRVLTDVEVLDAHHATALHLRIEGGIPEVHSYVLENPPRLVVELPWVLDRTAAPTIEVGSPRAERVRIRPRGNRLTLVIDAGEASDPFRDHGVAPTDQGLLITVGQGPVPPLQLAQADVEPRPPVKPPVRDPAPAPEPPPGAADPKQATDSAAEPYGAADPVLTPESATQEPQEPPPPAASGPAPTRADGIAFDVDRFVLRYAQAHPDQPPEAEILQVVVPLGRTSRGWVAPRDGVPTASLVVADVARHDLRRFYGSAIRHINEAIVAEYNRRGLAGVLVIPDEEDIDPRSGRDLRAPDQDRLRLVVWTGKLLEFRTFASGDRISEEERIDAAAHTRIKEGSPLQPGDLLRKQELDDYVSRLNRHPGRNVDLTLSSATEPGGVYLDFLVAEDRPFTAYSQISNTGTDETTDWRQRFGFQHSQLTGRDDILRVDYVTGDFDEVHAVFGSYETPVWQWDWLRWSFGGLYSEYDSTQFGTVFSRFEGDLWNLGSQLTARVFQYGDLFVDVFTGVGYDNVSVDNEPFPGFPTSGDTEFFYTEVGVSLERDTATSTIGAAFSTSFNIPDIAGTKARDLPTMGRLEVDEKNFEIMRWEVFTSFYLEPLIFPDSYDDPSSPRTSTLAHELAFSSRGQHSFNTRLVPQLQSIAGGLYSVRGYEQSVVAGDTLILGRAEYRLHIPRLLPIRPAAMQLPLIGNFRAAPQQVFGIPDWDLIVKGFFDVGRTIKHDQTAGEQNETLMGVGVGVELNILDRLILSFDWGSALRKARKKTLVEIDSGSSEAYFSATLVY
jgi:hypothetical protein